MEHVGRAVRPLADHDGLLARTAGTSGSSQKRIFWSSIPSSRRWTSGSARELGDLLGDLELESCAELRGDGVDRRLLEQLARLSASSSRIAPPFGDDVERERRPGRDVDRGEDQRDPEPEREGGPSRLRRGHVRRCKGETRSAGLRPACALTLVSPLVGAGQSPAPGSPSCVLASFSGADELLQGEERHEERDRR